MTYELIFIVMNTRTTGGAMSSCSHFPSNQQSVEEIHTVSAIDEYEANKIGAFKSLLTKVMS